MSERENITFDELSERIKRRGPEVGMINVEVDGIVTIIDKDGNVKGNLEIVSLETNQESEKNAT